MGRPDVESSKVHIINTFEPFFVEKVNDDLVIHYKHYLKSPNEYHKFLGQTFLLNWSFDSTAKALLGTDFYNSLTTAQFQELSKAVEFTLIRYAYESLSFYGKQRLSIIDVTVNARQTLAWLKVNVESNNFPDFHLDFLLKRTTGNKWKGVDFKFKGVSYVDLKKNSYRRDFEKLKLEGLLRKLHDKNESFFRDLCKGDVNFIDPKQPPCS